VKKIAPFLLILCVFCLPLHLQNEERGDAFALAHANPQEIPIETEGNMQPSQVDDDDFLYDPEMISRKLFQKKLPPLPGKRKIVWSFRMASSDLFL